MLLFHSQCLRGDVRGAFINSKIRRCASPGDLAGMGLAGDFG